MINSKKFKKIRLIAIYAILLFYSLSFLKHSISDLWFGVTSLMWPYTNGMILETVLIEKPFKERTGWAPGIKYTYTIENKTYHGNKTSYSEEFYDKEWALKAKQKYQSGDNVDIYYYPMAPEISCLKPGPGKKALFFSILGFSGIFIIAVSLYRDRKRAGFKK